MEHGRDANHWLYRLSAHEWIQAALAEIGRADAAFEARDRRGAMACCRRAAGMALNAALAAAPVYPERYGRSYMDHLAALVSDDGAPEEVRDAARVLVQTPLPGAPVIALRTGSSDKRMTDAARTVMAHAYAIVVREEPEAADETE